MIRRLAHRIVENLAKKYPLVAVTGPRQSGKTTLVKAVFENKPYVSLEDADAREFATEDPRGFLAQFPDGAVLDEVQRCPKVFSYLQTIVDGDGRMGLFVLTGSQQFGLLAEITQSLAGRIALVPLLPFSIGELRASGQAHRNLDQMLFAGSYPPIYDRQLDPLVWYGNYVSTFLERDVRQLVNVSDLGVFQLFLRLCAGRTGQLLNLSELGAACGISNHTARSWLSVLEASYIVYRLRPHFRNFNKRLTKTPKVYFYDTGLASWLLGVQRADQILPHPQRGALFETLILGELLKARFHRGLSSNLYFWRARGDLEVDVLVDRGLDLVPIEIKSGQTLQTGFFSGLKKWRGLAGETAAQPWLVYGGDQRLRRQEVEVVSWMDLEDLESELVP